MLYREFPIGGKIYKAVLKGWDVLAVLLEGLTMKDITIFTKPDCPKCTRLKTALPEDAPVKYIDASTTRGMAMASYHEVLKENFPVMVHDGNTIAGEWIKIKRYIEETGNEGIN